MRYSGWLEELDLGVPNRAENALVDLWRKLGYMNSDADWYAYV
jgi:hypothetical protein